MTVTCDLPGVNGAARHSLAVVQAAFARIKATFGGVGLSTQS